ncbi:gustatory receptor for sugar taste 64f-like isoform X1 [Photinus pyralis]|uniref:gustatory receptor for sugar taste 64f-like isoform X1 n=1 Tax=Photinus pyralis TaxID=7054 RepID=UPI0012671C43|nr:gustatory receptor for sugar taste 64f-like isoform X1 [Photinus pyralis]
MIAKWELDKMKWIKKYVSKSTRQKDLDEQRLFKSFAFVVLLGQVFGIMPLSDACGPHEHCIYFKWKSWKVLYTLLVVVGSVFCGWSTIYHMANHGSTMGLVSAVMFYLNSIVVHLLFVSLAKDWAHLMREWSAVDIGMRSYGWPSNLDARLKITSVIILSFATSEHLLSAIQNFVRAINCRNTIAEIFEYFFVNLAYPQVFSSITYSIGIGVTLQVITLISTFSWTYIDLFIILISSALALRFRQVSDRMESYLQAAVAVREIKPRQPLQLSDIVLWRNLREDYNRLSKLCRILNEHISYIVLVSFGSNLFFILVQFFNSLKPIRNTTEMVYFYFSFGFLIGRTICVSLYGSWIHDESQKFIPLLNSVPSTIYNIEVRRFVLHVGIETISLTGKKFFNVTRSIVLSIAGTIVTYELVLIQFYGGQIQKSGNETYGC